MRSSWLFYVVFPGQMQHSALLVFIIGVGEVFRRFMWNFFRMENEHMTNARHLIASRDVPLPFSLPKLQCDRQSIMEARSPFMDYSRIDERMSMRELDHAGYDC